MEGLRNHNFIIPRPRQIIKRKMPEMQRKIIDRTSAAGWSASEMKAFPALNIKSLRSSKSFLGDIASWDRKDFSG